MAPNHASLDFLDASQEAELIASAQAGDRAAFLKLARHYQRPLYRLSFAICRSEPEAAALAQEAFVRAWRDIAEYPSGRKFFPWIFRILRAIASRVPPMHGAPDGSDVLSMAIDALRPDDRMALALRIVEHIRYSEIAALLDMPTGIVTLRIAQARGLILAGNAEVRSL
jgi:RNA polymerase sigma-70 factor (ECF subfamily)